MANFADYNLSEAFAADTVVAYELAAAGVDEGDAEAMSVLLVPTDQTHLLSAAGTISI